MSIMIERVSLGLSIPFSLLLTLRMTINSPSAWAWAALMMTFSPSLTSVRQPVLQVAETLIPMLFQLIDGQRPDPDKVILEPRLIVRASSLRTTMKEQQP